MLMAYEWALETLEANPSMTDDELKEQFRWFMKTYHPDNQETGNVEIYRQALKAWRILTGGAPR